MSTSNVCNKEVGGSTSKSNNDDVDVCEVIGKLENMSTNNEDIISVCANCGKEGDDVTNTCNKCKKVMYCNAACKKRHRHKHKKECEEHVKRAAEHAAKLHDEQLFKEPPPQDDDCPICFVRLPSLDLGSVYMACCGKMICRGCVHSFQWRAIKAGRMKEDDVCPFCRTPAPTSNKEMIGRYNKRAELNDTTAIYCLGSFYAHGQRGLPQNYAKAIKLWHRAGELGNAIAYYSIGVAYERGLGIEVDEKKAEHYWELAAMKGNAYARCSLGDMEGNTGNKDRALKHWMIGVKNGDSYSLKNIIRMYRNGDATRDDYTKALQYYRVYLDEIKSDQRDEAAAFSINYKYYEPAV